MQQDKLPLQDKKSPEILVTKPSYQVSLTLQVEFVIKAEGLTVRVWGFYKTTKNNVINEVGMTCKPEPIRKPIPF